MKANSWLMMAALLGLCACGADPQDPAETSGSAGLAAGDESPRASGNDQFDRASFVLCPALEAHRAELAAMVGFDERDPARPIKGIGNECFIRGRYSHVSVELAPAINSSVAMQVRGYDAETSVVPELGNDAMFVDARSQPHVVFSLGNLIVDVGAEGTDKPTRETMTGLATRVRELLVAANK